MLTPLQPGPSAHVQARTHVAVQQALAELLQPVIDMLAGQVVAELERMMLPRWRWRARSQLVRLLRRRCRTLDPWTRR